MKTLYKFNWSTRDGEVTGLFVKESAEVDAAIGRPVGFGEILGKHSDINGQLDNEDLTILSVDPAFVERFEKVVGDVGYNPFDFMGKDSQ
jgi:hypothetical protein